MSHDAKVSLRGRTFMGALEANEMVILDGTVSDMSQPRGVHTSHQVAGRTVIDYVSASRAIIPDIKMCAHAPDHRFRADHSLLEVVVRKARVPRSDTPVTHPPAGAGKGARSSAETAGSCERSSRRARPVAGPLTFLNHVMAEVLAEQKHSQHQRMTTDEGPDQARSPTSKARKAGAA